MSFFGSHLYLLAEQKVGTHESNIENPSSSIFKAFVSNMVETDSECKWKSFKPQTLMAAKGSFGYSLCIAQGKDGQIIFQFGGIMALTESTDSCKICDHRLIYTKTSDLIQGVKDYNGTKLLGRKFPALSCPSNKIENEVLDQKLFIFSGQDITHRLVDDGGYFMYDIRSNYM